MYFLKAPSIAQPKELLVQRAPFISKKENGKLKSLKRLGLVNPVVSFIQKKEDKKLTLIPEMGAILEQG